MEFCAAAHALGVKVGGRKPPTHLKQRLFQVDVRCAALHPTNVVDRHHHTGILLLIIRLRRAGNAESNRRAAKIKVADRLRMRNGRGCK